MIDEIITDLRATKERLAADAQFDVKKLIERMRAEEQLAPRRGG